MAERTGLPRGVVVLDMIVRNSLAFGAMMIMVEVTPWSRLLWALRRLGMPAALVATIAMMHRYLFVLRDELDRMTTARRARTFGRRGPKLGVLAGLIGMLLFRAMLREERVFDAISPASAGFQLPPECRERGRLRTLKRVLRDDRTRVPRCQGAKVPRCQSA